MSECGTDNETGRRRGVSAVALRREQPRHNVSKIIDIMGGLAALRSRPIRLRVHGFKPPVVGHEARLPARHPRRQVPLEVNAEGAGALTGGASLRYKGTSEYRGEEAQTEAGENTRRHRRRPAE
jgi:hypothetical protein